MPVRRAVRMLVVVLVVLAALATVGCAGRRAPGTSPATAGPASAGAPASASASASPSSSRAVSPSAAASPAGAATPGATRPPAAAAGGVCRLLTFETVGRTVGTVFDVAASSGAPGTSQTCVLQKVGSSAPDLVLTVTPAPGLTAAVFGESYVPAGGTALTGLGLEGYRLVTRTGTAGGPRVEVGWLSASGRVLGLAYTLATDEDPSLTGQVVERLVVLGRGVDAAR